jgi:8-oxo-dGTP pyrophosphatase MutT (NUDIX family)
VTSKINNLIDESYYRRPPGVPTRPAAGGVVVRVQGNKVFCALISAANRTRFALPKGGIEAGEDEETAARREIEEEAGLSNLVLLEKLGIRERLVFEKTHWGVTHYFLFATAEDASAPLDAENHPEPCAWFELDALPPMKWPEQQELIVSNRERIRDTAQKYFGTAQGQSEM